MIDNYMLYSNIQAIDLHGYDRYSALLKTKEFIKDNNKLNNKLLKIIHGRGEGILKEEIHKYLKTEPLVKNYKLDIYNPGATIIELK